MKIHEIGSVLWMNILLFLTPKNQVAFLHNNCTLRQALEKMEFHHYTAIPMIDCKGEYVGTLTEGDLLWSIKKNFSLNFKQAENFPIMKVQRHHHVKAVKATTHMEDLINTVLNQNYVPVVDDRNVFIGIITRKRIIQYFYEKAYPNQTNTLPQVL